MHVLLLLLYYYYYYYVENNWAASIFFVETMIFFWYIESSKDQHLFEIDFINTYTIYHINITYIYCYFWSWTDWLIDCISFFQEKNNNLFQTFKL